MKQTTKKKIYSVATLSGTIVGVGLFSLPYLASKVGLLVMLAYFLVLGIVVSLIHIHFGELAVATPDFKRLPGFAKIHLGAWGKKVALVSSIVGTFGGILAYLIVGGSFLQGLLSPFLPIKGNTFYTLVYFVLGSMLIFLGIKIIAQIEALSLVLFFGVLVMIFFKSLPLIDISGFLLPPQNLDLFTLFLPYGPILFSLWGAALIPEVEEMLERDKNLLKRIIPVATFIPVVIYLFFTYLVVGITGPQTTEAALTGLRDFLGNGVVNLTLFLGVLTTFTSFITLGLTLKRIFWYDLGIGENLAWIITCFVPLAIFLLGLKSFIAVISFGGGIMLGIDGILILLMHQRSIVSKKEEGRAGRSLLTMVLVSLFLIGLILEIIYFIKS